MRRTIKELCDLIDETEHKPNVTEEERVLIRKIIDIFTTDKRFSTHAYHENGEVKTVDFSKDRDNEFWQYLKNKGWGY